MPHTVPFLPPPHLPAFPPEGVRHVVFDVVGTLVEPWPSVPVAYAMVAAAHGVEARADDLRRSFALAWERQEAIDAAAVPPFATNRCREVERWRGIVHDVFATVAAYDVREAVFLDLWDHFARPESWRPLARGPILLRAALDAGFGVALASNFDERLLPLAARLKPLSHATDVFASSELGWRKPSLGFFRAVEERLGREPQELLLVGDDARLDIAAASAAGWRCLAVA